MKLLLVANPTAAGRRARRLLPSLRDFLAGKADAFDYAEARNADDLRLKAAEAARAGYDRVFAAGGDGTAHAALNGLLGSSTALGILPLGHGNDLARSLGIPLNPRQAADFLLHAPVGSMDVIRVGKRAYAGVAGIGFDAATNRRANAWGGWPTGHLRYFLAGLRTLATFRPLEVDLVSDSEEFSGQAMWVVVANTPCYGGGVRIAPDAAPDDGVLDVCIIEKISKPGLLALYPRLLRGSHLRAPAVRYFRSTWVRFRTPVGAAFYGDGEFLGEVPLEVRIDPGAVRVLRRAG
jgi:diacylglycerol kinase (ATP)